MNDIQSKVIERDLNPYHLLINSFFAGLAEMGMLNQGSVNIVVKQAAEHFFAYPVAKGLINELEVKASRANRKFINYIINYGNDLQNRLDKYNLLEDYSNSLKLIIQAPQCRICPKEAGCAEVKGILCSLPSFLEKTTKSISGNNERISLLTRGIEKNGTGSRAFY